MADEVRIKIKIDSNSQELVLMKQQVQELGKSFTDADSFANTFMKRINLAGHIYASYQVLNQTIGELGKRGLEVNKEIQKLTNSLTTSSAVMMANTDVYGNAITVADKYKIAQIDAAKSTEMLQKANINTPHSMNQTVKIYDSMYFGMKKTGASTKDMVEITEKLSIAAGNRVGFDAFLSAMDGISTGTVEANSEMGRFLSSVGLSNEEIKNSSDVVQLFKDKLSGFQAIQDFETKMSNLTNSTDMFAKNLMKIPFDWIESKLPTTAKMFDDWAKSINEVNIYLSNVSNLSTYDELINKQYQLMGQIKEVKNDKFMWDSEQKEKLSSLNGELEIVFKKLSEIRELEKKAENIGTKFDSKPIDDLVEKTLNPYGTKLDEINKKWQKNFEDMQKNGKDTSKIYQAWNKEISDLDQEEADKKEKIKQEQLSKTKEIATEQKRIAKEQEKSAETLSQAYSETAQIGMSDYNKSLISIADKVGALTKAGVDNIEILRVQGILLDEVNQKQALETTKTDLSYYERKVQLQTQSYEKELELQGISYGQKVLDIEGSSGESAEKERLIELEAQLYDATVARMELERNTEFQETISGFYDDMLGSQLELNSALYDFGDGFGEVGNKIAAVSKSLAQMQNADLKSKKEIAKLNDKYAKEFKKYSKDEIKTKELTITYHEEEQQLKEQTLMNQIGGLSEFAGQSKQFFGEQTTAYKTLQAIEAVGHAARMTAMAAELPGQITSLSVNIASALAGQGSIPIVGFALVVGMAALLAGLGVMSAGGGAGGGASGGGGSKKPSQFDIREQELEDLYTPMTDRLDRQIELLESIDKQGSASALSLIGSKISFEKDYALAVNEINKKLPTDVRGYGLDFNNALAPIEAALGFNIADVIRIKKSGWDKSEKRIYTDFGALNSGYNMMKLISAYFEDTSKNSAIAALFGGHNALNLAANELQATLGDFTSGIVDSLDDLKDASSDFKDHYDTITGSMHYENKKLAQAFSDVQALTNGKTFAEYLKQNIDEIDALSNTFSDAVVNTLLSQDPADMAKQLAVLEDLQNQTGLVFKGGAKDALDFLESIELVATAMSTSSSNIKDFINDFKSEDLLALDLSNKLGTNLALNYDDLALKFEDMANDIYGLTDSELEFLEANKSYLERIQDAKKQALEDELELTKSSVSTIQSMSNSLDSVITKLRGNLSTTAATSIAKFNESMSSTLLLSNGNDYKALEDSLKNTISYSDALNNADYFSSSRDMQFAQAIAANQFESMDVKLEDELSVLQQISANTSAMIEALENSASFDIYAQNLETSVKIKAFANGGIVTGPTFGLIGEAGYSKAVIPLKNPNDPLGQKELIAEIRALRKEVADLNNSSSKTAENTTPSRYVS